MKVPPLSERRADILPLISQFAAQLSAYHGTSAPRLSRAATAVMLGYDWPGNVRELRNTIEMVCLLRAGKNVRVRDLPEALQEAAPGTPATGAASRLLTIDLDEPLERILDRVIRGALTLERGNRSRAAERLGVSLRTMQRYAAKGLGEG